MTYVVLKEQYDFVMNELSPQSIQRYKRSVALSDVVLKGLVSLNVYLTHLF